MGDPESGAGADGLVPPRDEKGGRGENAHKGDPGFPHGNMDASSATRNEGFVTDPDLARLLISGTEALGEQGLDRILRANQKFNMPTEVQHSDGTWITDNNFQAKRVLTEIPPLVEAARTVHVEPEQVEHLLLHTINASDFSPRRLDVDINLLTRGLHISADREEEITTGDIQKIEALITAGAEKDVIPNALDSFVTARTVGLTLEDSVGLVSDFLHADHYIATGYAMPHFSKALKTLLFTKVDPEVIKETFQAVQKIPRGERDDAYDLLQEALAYGCPVDKMRPEFLLQSINQQVASGATVVDAIKRIFGDNLQLGDETDSAPKVFIPSAERDAYFVDKPGNLEFAVLPYRTDRSLNEGLRDLETLARASAYQWEDVGEGSWVFDPAAQRWYSLGGETTYLGGGRVRHKSILYDISQLSDRPISLHIHPDEYAIREEDKYGFVFPTNADYRAIAKMMEESSENVRPRSLIVHPLGITEFVYPDDIEEIRGMSEVMEQTRDRFFSRFPDGIQAVAESIGQYEFAELAVREINNDLPEGFSIILHPPGAELE